MSVQICTRCVMDNKTDKSITFNDKGICNYCSDIAHRLPLQYFPDEKGKWSLKA